MRLFVFFMLALLSQACALYHLARYHAYPNYPREPEQEQTLAGLSNAVRLTVLPDGRYKIESQTERDLAFVTGYLQARDRMFQMDLLRHMAEGRLAELVGNVAFGDGTALDLDRFNRFLGLADQADAIIATLNAEEREVVDAFVAGINLWIREGKPSLEHRLLGIRDVEPWHAKDSLALFRMIMFGMTHNYTRELRRLLIACDAGLEAMERIWPSKMDFGVSFLPSDMLRAETYATPPAVAPELVSALPALCPPKSQFAMSTVLPEHASLPFWLAELYWPVAWLRYGISASNNWVVSGQKTQSGKPILENDPHLPHLNPPILWGAHQVLPDREVVGFTVPGLHLIIFGHNFHVAWGATINTVDLQDLYVEKPTADATGYFYDGTVEPFKLRTETFRIRGSDAVTVTARLTRHGPILNDLEPFLTHRIPLTALRTVSVDSPGDARAARSITLAKTADDFVRAVQEMDTICISWVYADTLGNIGFTSPCRIPNRPHHWGTVPVPGWLSCYEWAGFVPKDQLPQARNPLRGWIATANNNSVPFERFPTALNNDANPPNRYQRIAAFLDARNDLTPADMATLALDTGLAFWSKIRSALDQPVCKQAFERQTEREAAAIFCGWDGQETSDSAAATLFELTTNAMLDRALADELSEGSQGRLWRYVQAIPHFEALVHWTWLRAANDPVWDDTRTPELETRDTILRAAFVDAVALAKQRFGEQPSEWQWGKVRPFVLRHPFGSRGRIAGAVFNGPSLPGAGGPETVFKNQFLRSDRERMHVSMGPAIRLIIDMSQPNEALFALAGGQSGWTRSPHYGDLTADWMAGKLRPLTPQDGRVVRYVPVMVGSTTTR